jgi:hypothetical protein
MKRQRPWIVLSVEHAEDNCPRWEGYLSRIVDRRGSPCALNAAATGQGRAAGFLTSRKKPVTLSVEMVCGLTCWLKSLLLMATLFGLLGGMSAYGYFFWENREMCPCAAAGLEGAEGIAVKQPYSDELMIRRSLSFGGIAALFGIGVAVLVTAPRARRLRDIEPDEPPE